MQTQTIQETTRSKTNSPKGCRRVLFQTDNLPVLQAVNSESVSRAISDPPLSGGGKAQAACHRARHVAFGECGIRPGGGDGIEENRSGALVFDWR